MIYLYENFEIWGHAMNERELKKRSLLAEVACDYYERGLDQNQIAERLCLSRTRVSRLLKEAEEKGIVTIQVTINYDNERHYELEERLKNRFPIKHARVLNGRGRTPHIQRHVGRLAASYIMEVLKKDMVIGTSWGTTLSDTICGLSSSPHPVQIVQCMGSVPCQSPDHTPQAIVANFARLLHGQGCFLNLPLYIEEDYVRTTMCNDLNNRKILNLGMFSDMILTSVNDLNSINTREFWKTYMTSPMFQELCEKGAVGAMFARFFDQNGREIDCDWNRRCVSISLPQVKNVPDAVLIASGTQKASAVSCAIKSGIIDTLITDGTTASVILGLK